MIPDSKPQNQTGASGLPAIPLAMPVPERGKADQGIPAFAPLQPEVPPSPAAPNANLSQASADQTRRAMQQYAHDPHGLSAAWQEIKAEYLARQYQITTGQK